MNRHFQTVPVLDIAGLFSPEATDRRRVGDQIRDAARDVGFFYVTGHAVPQAAREDLLAAASRFFDQPTATKMESYIGRSVNHSGYVPIGEEVFASGKIDAKEAYDIGYDYAGPPTGGMLGPTLWPPLAGFKDDVGAYYALVAGLARVMFRGFALALDLAEDYFDDKLTDPPSQLRLIHYPYNPDAVDAEGIGAHTDYECFTILSSTAPGLEVMNGEGRWIDAPPIPGAFIINIGDMIETLSNGAFIATSHRVRQVAEERYSFPFFAACDYPTVVEPLPGFVSEARPPRYPPVVSGEASVRPDRPDLRLPQTPHRRGGPCAAGGLSRSIQLRSGGPRQRRRTMTLEELARARPFARPLAVPEWTLGCFRRRCITYFNGEEDVTTAVLLAAEPWADGRHPNSRS